MDVLIYIIICLVWGLVNCLQNGGMTVEDRADNLSLDDNGGDLVNLADIPIGSNLSAHYNPNAFNRIIDQFHLR